MFALYIVPSLLRDCLCLYALKYVIGEQYNPPGRNGEQRYSHDVSWHSEKKERGRGWSGRACIATRCQIWAAGRHHSYTRFHVPTNSLDTPHINTCEGDSVFSKFVLCSPPSRSRLPRLWLCQRKCFSQKRFRLESTPSARVRSRIRTCTNVLVDRIKNFKWNAFPND